MINPLINPSYLAPPIIASVASFVLAAVVWYGSRRKSFSNQLFTGILLTIGVWGLVLFAMRASPDVQRAVLWDRALPVATLATFVLFYHFTLAYTDTHGKRGILLTFYLILATVAAISPTELLVEENAPGKLWLCSCHRPCLLSITYGLRIFDGSGYV